MTLRHLFLAFLCAGFAACTTTPSQNPVPNTPGDKETTSTELPSGGLDSTDQVSISTPGTESGGTSESTENQTDDSVTGSDVTPPVTPSVTPEVFSKLTGWQSADLRPALKAFQRGCAELEGPERDIYLNSSVPIYGRANDWQAACIIGRYTDNLNSDAARRFFESEFLPITISSDVSPEGLVTGYYQPEINARRVKDDIYSEAILTKPNREKDQNRPRSDISETIAAPIAYGKPIEVFFMQIQGSGVLKFPDGQRVRAAYAANNGYSYTSIGRVLIERGELTKDQASKQDIENWMKVAGPAKSRELMNQNKRYIFFEEEVILPDEGPKGAMRVPLTAMGSIAIDPSYHPYGVPIWIETQIPMGKGDYKGVSTGLLAITQDTGKAIRGKLRADLYFGSGTEAGDKAGVMKHPARWVALLPFHLAFALINIS